MWSEHCPSTTGVVRSSSEHSPSTTVLGRRRPSTVRAHRVCPSTTSGFVRAHPVLSEHKPVHVQKRSSTSCLSEQSSRVVRAHCLRPSTVRAKPALSEHSPSTSRFVRAHPSTSRFVRAQSEHKPFLSEHIRAQPFFVRAQSEHKSFLSDHNRVLVRCCLLHKPFLPSTTVPSAPRVWAPSRLKSVSRLDLARLEPDSQPQTSQMPAGLNLRLRFHWLWPAAGEPPRSLDHLLGRSLCAHKGGAQDHLASTSCGLLATPRSPPPRRIGDPQLWGVAGGPLAGMPDSSLEPISCFRL